MTFEELQQIQKDNRIFVNSENMVLEKIKLQSIDLFSDKVTPSSTYIKLNFLKYESKVYKLRLSLHDGRAEDTIKFQCNFYKGCHK